MYCANCGQEINENDRFCPSCGKAREAALGSEAIDAAKETPVETSADSSEGSSEVEAPAAAEGSNFKATVKSSKTHARRRVPILVLVAFVTMLVAGVAYAAYYVYTTYIAPVPVEQAEETPEAVEPIEEAPVAYSATLASESVMAGNETGNDSPRSSRTWTYPVFSSTAEDQTSIDNVNRIAKGHFDDAVEEINGGGECWLLYNTEITYQNENIVATVTFKPWNAGGVSNYFFETHLYDLSAGTELTYEDYLGTTRAELNTLTSSALTTWKSNNPDLWNSGNINNAGFAERDENELFYLCDEGLAMVTSAYDLNTGTHVESILVQSSGSAKDGAKLTVPAYKSWPYD